jgi:hypothetical protein
VNCVTCSTSCSSDEPCACCVAYKERVHEYQTHEEPENLHRNCYACGEPINQVPTNWFKITSEAHGFVFFHRGQITRKLLANIIRVIKFALRKKELLK